MTDRIRLAAAFALALPLLAACGGGAERDPGPEQVVPVADAGPAP